jgi:hypothetical protein
MDGNGVGVVHMNLFSELYISVHFDISYSCYVGGVPEMLVIDE